MQLQLLLDAQNLIWSSPGIPAAALAQALSPDSIPTPGFPHSSFQGEFWCFVTPRAESGEKGRSPSRPKQWEERGRGRGNRKRKGGARFWRMEAGMSCLAGFWSRAAGRNVLHGRTLEQSIPALGFPIQPPQPRALQSLLPTLLSAFAASAWSLAMISCTFTTGLTR